MLRLLWLFVVQQSALATICVATCVGGARALDPSRMAIERQKEDKKDGREKEKVERYSIEHKPKKSASDLLVESRDARLRAKVCLLITLKPTTLTIFREDGVWNLGVLDSF